MVAEHVTLIGHFSNPNCELISLTRNFCVNYIKQVIRRRNIDEIPHVEFKYGVFRIISMDRLHDRYPNRRD